MHTPWHSVLHASHKGLIDVDSAFLSPDNQEGSDWRDEDEKLPGHENLTEKDIELFRHIQELALQVRRQRDREGQIRDDPEEGPHCRVRRRHQRGGGGLLNASVRLELWGVVL